MKEMTYSGFVKKLKRCKSFIIASHYGPDGDGIGSVIALSLALLKMKKKVVMYSRDGVPENLRFLPLSEKIVTEIPAQDFDMAVMLDCAQRKRISDDFASFKRAGEFACVDHHLVSEPEADFTLIDENAASTGEVILKVIESAKIAVNKDIAMCVYTTLAVDTGFFKYSNTTAAALSLAAKLVKKGASTWEVAKHLEESHPASRLKLLAASLASMDVMLNGKYATMDVTQDMLNKSQATMDMSDEFASYPRQIASVEVSALFREVDPGLTKVSMRSKDYVDVSKVAKSFGGGGHIRAAGFRMREPLKLAKERVLNEVKKHLS